REVLVGEVGVGDPGVDQRHARRAVTEQSRDRLEAHTAVEALGGQGVTKLVRMDVSHSGPTGHGGDVASDGAPVESVSVVALEEQTVLRRPSPRLVVVDESDEEWVEGDVAIIVELAHRDAQPPGVSDWVHGVIAKPSAL